MTNVGATKLYPGQTVLDPESAVVDPIGDPYSVAYSSGGGFSNIYSIPEYQAAAVAKYVLLISVLLAGYTFWIPLDLTLTTCAATSKTTTHHTLTTRETPALASMAVSTTALAAGIPTWLQTVTI